MRGLARRYSTQDGDERGTPPGLAPLRRYSPEPGNPIPSSREARCPTAPFWPWLLPRSGMTSLQGRAKGMMECWYTSAERQPGERGEMVSAGLGTRVSPVLGHCCSGWTATGLLAWFFTVVLMPHVAFPLAETTVPTEGSGRRHRRQGHLRNNKSGRGPHAAPRSTLAMV